MDFGRNVMVKVSGEQLESERYTFDNERAAVIVEVLKALRDKGYSVVCVVGGGNVVRGAKLAVNGFPDKVAADHMGMLATVQNGIFLNQILLANNVDSRLFSNVRIDGLVESMSYQRAKKSLEKGSIVVIAGGTGKPGVTTDTAVVMGAFELGCDIAIKTTKVNGVYDDDPNLNHNANRYETITFNEALSNPKIQVMDKAALGFAMHHNITIGVCQPFPEAVLGLIGGDTQYGTIVHG